MKVVVAGTGYVGLVTGVTLSEIGHNVTCVDVDENKIKTMQSGISPIYEEGLPELMKKNKDRLKYTTDYKSAYKDAEVIFIGVGTPERADGSANLDYVYSVCNQIAESVEKSCVVVIKSTVPIGTNDKIEKYFKGKIKNGIKIDVVSNPEFLAQGTAIRDIFNAPRIIVGTENLEANNIMTKLYEPFTKEPYNIKYLSMNRTSAEMVKYASNDFLALKISYISEIANFCESVGADITKVTAGMGLDPRIGSNFLKAGIGYGGSCFPKDTKALHWLSKEKDSELKTVKACIEVNKSQKIRLLEKLLEYYDGNISGLNIGMLGVTFKPGTDDLREAPSLDNTKLLLDYGVNITVYDPIGLNNFKKIFDKKVNYANSIEEAIKEKDAILIMTEWPEIVNIDVEKYETLMKTPVVFDGRNCYSIDTMAKTSIYYNSIGRKVCNDIKTKVKRH